MEFLQHAKIKILRGLPQYCKCCCVLFIHVLKFGSYCTFASFTQNENLLCHLHVEPSTPSFIQKDQSGGF